MRLARLNLARYGKFTDFVLDFGAKQLEKPDFHIIFGSNEAGKTTALTAILDLLYGISKGSQVRLQAQRRHGGRRLPRIFRRRDA